MLIVLSAILIVLILIICGDKGSKSIITTGGNALLLFISIFLMYRGANPVIVTMVMSILAAAMILFFQNEVNPRTKMSFWATLIVIAVLVPLVYYLIAGANSQGFVPEEYEITDSNGYTRNIGLPMISVQISVMIIALIGAVVDTSVAVSSSIYEIYQHSEGMEKQKLLASGMTVGKSILSTSMHTIFYIYIAEYMTLMMQYVQDYSFEYMINSKSFAQGFLSITISGIGCCLIVPATVILTVNQIYKEKKC